jgi:hypothetical protein
LLEGLYGYGGSEIEPVFQAMLAKPEVRPDMSTWTEGEKFCYGQNEEVVLTNDVWMNGEAYDPQTRKMMRFDPIAFYPQPERFSIFDRFQDYRRLYNWVRKARTKGYELQLLGIDDMNSELIAFYLRTDELGSSICHIHDPCKARHLLGHLIPGVE